MTTLLVREHRAEDIPLIVGYWHSMEEADLKRMFIDRTQISSKEEFTVRLTRLLTTPVTERPADPLIWAVGDQAIGFTNLNNIQRGTEAEIHLHMFRSEFRRKGLGRQLFMLSVQEYFKRHDLKKIICQPASTNPHPNGMMRTLGIKINRTYVTKPSQLCFEHEVNRYEIIRST